MIYLIILKTLLAVNLNNTNEMAQESKSFCEKLWEKFEPYADGHFLSEIKSDEKFQDRFW